MAELLSILHFTGLTGLALLICGAVITDIEGRAAKPMLAIGAVLLAGGIILTAIVLGADREAPVPSCPYHRETITK